MIKMSLKRPYRFIKIKNQPISSRLNGGVTHFDWKKYQRRKKEIKSVELSDDAFLMVFFV